MTFEELMDYAISRDCSDVHITQGTNLAVRRYGELIILDEKPTFEEARDMIYAILSTDEIKRVEEGEDVDVGRMIDNNVRIRANIYHQRNNLACSIRLLMAQIPEFEDLGLPEVIKTLATANNGIILVTEDPIEYIYPHNRAMIHQRELGRDVDSFAAALHSALREDPDIILVGEMRDFETISAAITAAETGHLVLSTLHTQSAAQTINRIIDGSPSDMKSTIRSQFAASIKGVISQQLLPTSDGNGRVLTTEVMVGTSAIKNLILEDKIHMIPGAIQSAHQQGMHTLNDDLVRLNNLGLISRKTALDAAYDPQDLEKVLGVSNFGF